MTILSKYICRRLILYYFAFVVVMVVFFVFVDFMEHIDRITASHVPLSAIGLYYMCYFPRVFIEISWVSFLVAILFVLGSIAKNNEFTAMTAGGISIYRIGVPVFSIGLLLSILVFCVQEFAMPPLALRAYQMEKSDFARDSERRVVYNIAGLGKENRFYYIDSMDITGGTMSGVHIHKSQHDRIVQRIDADRAIWDEDTGRWYLEEGIERSFDERGILSKSVPFSRIRAPIKESPTTLEAYSLREGELTFRQLRRQVKNLQRSGYDAHRLKVDYQMKFSLPVINLVVVFLGLPFALECRRGGLTIGFALSLMTALLYYGAFQISLSLGRGGFFPAAVAAWLANFLFLGIGAGLTTRART